MTNFDRYKLYTEGLISPDSYIEWGYLYLISAALQRRVWIGPSHMPLFPNIYVILVGEPGVGKGLVIKTIADLLKYHKMPDPTNNNKIQGLTPVDRAAMEEIAKIDYRTAQEVENGEKVEDKNKKVYEKPLLFPVAADATTYEALVRAMSKSLRRINYEEFDETLKRNAMKIYTHSSLCFCLEEISSLFRKRTEDLVHFLIQAYDCGDYKYETKTQGVDRIKKCCLNFFGGTTPGFMQSTFDDQLLTEGFSSRTFFIFASQNRKTTLWIPTLSPEQKECYYYLLGHLEKLSHLYGNVNIPQDVKDWLEGWWKEAQTARPNVSSKLNPYYARKNIHVLKLAMAIHFSESLEMNMTREPFEKALKLLDAEERKMHYALGLDSSNPLAVPARKILKFVETRGKQMRRQLLAEFWEALPRGAMDLDEALEYLQAMGKMKTTDGTHPITKETVVYYDIVKKQSFDEMNVL